MESLVARTEEKKKKGKKGKSHSQENVDVGRRFGG